ncbi:hypothetical protein GCM10007989_01640 [Devosia pacifica]|uniref:Sec-independent protein translocase protein TatB n=1 Tax=Devosia pacifica TaxID=1335967 RepID=A0A918RUL4_9HYPH|nr:Sec-independent protein translocase protein TatB [Devosia pacifica]GHA11006.1 hypothetical protein GCM10007989_01640 [Devosia pacifica]
MLGLGWTEMLVLGVVALIVIGPKDLPAVMQQVGKYVGQIKRLGSEFQREVNRSTGLDEVRNLRKSITEPLRKSTDEIRREFNSISKSGKVEPSGKLKPSKEGQESVVDEIRAAANMSPAPPVTREEPPVVTPDNLSAAQDDPEAAPVMTSRVKAAGRTGSKAPKSAMPKSAGTGSDETAEAAPKKKRPAKAASGSGTKKAAPKAPSSSAKAPRAPRKKAAAPAQSTTPDTPPPNAEQQSTDKGDAQS